MMVLTPYICNVYGTTTNAQFDPIQTEDLPVVNDLDLKVETVIEGLEFQPTMAFLDVNDILVLEKNKKSG